MQLFTLSRRFSYIWACCIALAMLFVSTVHAADFKPFLTLKVDSISSLIGLSEKFVGLAPPAAAAAINAEKAILAPFKKLPGVNAAGTFNLAIQRNENSPSGLDILLFLPITNVEQFAVPGQEMYVNMIKGMLKKEGERYVITSPLGEFIGYQKKNYLVIAPMNIAEFASTVEPKSLFADLDKFTIGFTANFENLTAEDIEMMLGNLIVPLAMQGGDAAENLEESLTAIKDLHAEMSLCTLGISIDERTLDITGLQLIVPKKDSPTAEKIQNTKGAKTKFGGFLHDHAKTIVSRSYIDYLTDNEVANMKEVLQLVGGSFMEGLNEAAEDEEEGTQITRFAEIILACLQEQLDYYTQNKSVDIAFSLDSDVTFLFAQTTTQPELTTKIGSDLYNALPELLGNEQGAAIQKLITDNVKKDYDTAADFSISSLTNPFANAPPELELPSALKNVPINLLWAVKNKEAVAVAIGWDFAKTERALKTALGKTTSAVTPKQTTVFGLRPLGEFFVTKWVPLLDKLRIPVNQEQAAMFFILAAAESSAKVIVTTEFPKEGQLQKMQVSGRCLAVVVRLMIKQAELTAQRSAQEFMKRQQAEQAAQQEQQGALEQPQTPGAPPTPTPPAQGGEMQNPFSE